MELVDAALKPFEFVLDPEFFFFEGGHPNFVPIGMGHFGFDHFLKFSVFFGQFHHVSFKGHRSHLFTKQSQLEHDLCGLSRPVRGLEIP